MKQVVAMIVPWIMVGCGPQTGNQLEMLFVQAPDNEDCSFAADSSDALSGGFFDPTGQDFYLMGVSIRNHLVSDEKLVVSKPENEADIRGQSRNATLLGFNVCFFLSDSIGGGPTGSDSASLVDCDTLAAGQRSFVPASGVIGAESLGVGVFRTLTTANLQALFGTGFTPRNIPTIGVPYAVDSNNNGVATDEEDQIYYRFALESPDVTGRSSAWGDYPAVRSVQIVLQIQALAALQTGKEVKSNWLVFPMELCVGCMSTVCGDWIQVPCIQACGGLGCPNPYQVSGKPSRRCAVDNPGSCLATCEGSDAICTPFGFEGTELTGNQCLKYQGIGEINCGAFSTCNQYR